MFAWSGKRPAIHNQILFRTFRGMAGAALVGCLLLAAFPAHADPATTSAPAASEKTTGTKAGNTGTGEPPATEATGPQGSASTEDAAKAKRKAVADCAGGEVFRTLANTANSPAIIYNANLVPAGSSVDFGLATTLDVDSPYFALLTVDDTKPRDSDRHGARARKASDTDDLVAKHLLSAGDTIVSVDVPASAAGFWTRQNLYIYQCDHRRPVNVSYLPVYVSPMATSILLTVTIVGIVYFLAASALARLTGQSFPWPQAVNPIRITAGADNRGSLSAFQVFFFSILVFGMLAFVLLRTGVLSDLSTTILELLGISGVGAAAAKGADSSKTSLDPANRAWLLSKDWYASASPQPANQPTFYDLISSDGGFDVYRFQSLLFSGTVGIALLIGGITQLASFTVPQNILGILGLSQIVYIAGKLVSTNGTSDLNTVLSDVRNAEAEFREAALAAPPAGGAAVAAPANLQEAIDRARPAYTKYREKVRAAARLFEQVTGITVGDSKIEPGLGGGVTG
ncbi:hypothetical protein ACVIGA_000641 [Bradyrhizobium sp. USDA 3240]